MPRTLRGLVALACAGAALFVWPVGAGAGDADIDAFRGLGTWVDVYDYVPDVQDADSPPDLTVESVDDMAALGVETLYLQAAQDDDRIADHLRGSRQVAVVHARVPLADDFLQR